MLVLASAGPRPGPFLAWVGLGLAVLVAAAPQALVAYKDRARPRSPLTKRHVPALTVRCSVRALLLDVPALRAWALLASPVVILEHPPSLPPPSDADEHASQTLSKK